MKFSRWSRVRTSAALSIAAALVIAPLGTVNAQVGGDDAGHPSAAAGDAASAERSVSTASSVNAVITPDVTSVNIGTTVTFSGADSTSDAAGPLDFEWRDSGLPGNGVASGEETYVREFDKTGVFEVELTVRDGSGGSDTATETVTVVDTSTPPPGSPALVSVDPERLLDTRQWGPVPFGAGWVAADEFVKVPIRGIPESAVGVALNVTVVTPGADGHLTVYPCGDRPNTSNLNYRAGETVGNSVVAMLGDNQGLCVWTLSTTNIVVDLTGYVPEGSAVHAFNPVRVLDTRTGDGDEGSRRLEAGGTVTVPVAARSDVPVGAAAVFVNLAAVGPSADGHLTAYPCGEVPPTSSLNYVAGTTRSSSVLVALGADGEICVRSHAATDVTVDVLGWVDRGDWVELESDRKFDTRAKYPAIAPSKKGQLLAGTVAKVQVTDPATTAGVFVHVTAVAPSADGHLTVFPCGERPTTSGLNYQAGVTTTNMVFAKVDASGSVCVYTHATTDLVVDYDGSVVAKPAA